MTIDQDTEIGTACFVDAFGLPGLIHAARVMGEAGNGSLWVDVSIMGQHLPQMYRVGEIHEMPADLDVVKSLGVCPECLGYGTQQEKIVPPATSIDELSAPCEACRGTGRPHLTITITHDGPSTTYTSMQWEKHEPVLHPLTGTCAECGEVPNNALHV